MAELADKTAVGMAVAILAEAFNRKATKPMAEAYRIGLEGLAPEQITRAAAIALKTCRFMPTPSELRELAGELRPADRAERAWAAFADAVLRHGAYASITFDDVVINATVHSLGGWVQCCELPVKEFDTFFRARFLKTYESFVRTGVRGEACRPLAGIFQKENALNGHAIGTTGAYTGQLLTVATGLPALPNAPKVITEANPDRVPRITFKKA